MTIYYSICQKSLFFFNASNPSIKNGGFIMESKKEIYDLIPQKYFPKTILVKEKTSFDAIEQMVAENEFNFPLIAKPDIGLRGSAVKKIEKIQDLKNYWQKADFDFLIQYLIPFENEIGVFYVRYPNQKTGKITGIVAKEFMIVTGNGADSIADLVLKNPRFALQYKTLAIEYGEKLHDVLPNNEKMNLVPYGNHARGAKFLDANHLISEKMTHVMNRSVFDILFIWTYC